MTLFCKNLIIGLLLFFVAPATGLAFSSNYDPGSWVFDFHFEIKDGVLRTQTDAMLPYEASPGDIAGQKNPMDADYRIDIIGVRGNILGSYGFDDPKTIVPALQKSVFDIKTPFFANGSKALIYDRYAKKLFEISLTGSSFCNDNATCDARVGETYLNCPNDCPAPDNSPTPIVSPTEPSTPAPVTATPPPAEPTPVVQNTEGEATVEYNKNGITSSNTVIQMTAGVGLILLSLVGLVYWRRRRSFSE